MINEKEMTAPNVSVGADTEQSILKQTNNSITDNIKKSNDILEKLKEMDRLSGIESDPNHIYSMTMEELFDIAYGTKPPIIENILTPGMYVIAGTPKVGKSFLMAQIAYYVSTGMQLWNNCVTQGDVLYLALEDRYERLQQRLSTMFGYETSVNLHLAVKSGTLEKGLETQLQNFIYSHPNTQLIIIDTLKKINDIGRENCSYAKDYEVIDRLKNVADKNGICILVVHHTRKEKAEDIFEMISGTNGIYGAADGALVLWKENRTSTQAFLSISGRDFPDQKITLQRNPETLQWDYVACEVEKWEPPSDPLLELISNKLNGNIYLWEGSPTELTIFLNSDLKPNMLTKKLNINASILLNKYNIKYEYFRFHDGRRIKLERQTV